MHVSRLVLYELASWAPCIHAYIRRGEDLYFELAEHNCTNQNNNPPVDIYYDNELCTLTKQSKDELVYDSFRHSQSRQSIRFCPNSRPQSARFALNWHQWISTRRSSVAVVVVIIVKNAAQWTDDTKSEKRGISLGDQVDNTHAQRWRKRTRRRRKERWTNGLTEVANKNWIWQVKNTLFFCTPKDWEEILSLYCRRKIPPT